METDPAAVRRAIAARDGASTRVRLLTAGALAGAAALTGVFAALAAGSTHARKIVTHVARVNSAPVHAGRVVAPDPPLVAADQSPVAPAPPAQAPSSVPNTGPAVVVSGGS